MKTKNKEERKQEFINKAIKKHGNKYDYSKINYINSKTKVCIICPIHGEFYQEPSAHVRGYDCPKCSHSKQGKRTMNTDIFIRKSKKIFGNKYTYENTKYVNADTKICITCPEHGDFYMMPFNHITSKQGCPKCVGRNLTTQEIIELFKQAHGNKYDYSKVIYDKAKSKVEIICPVHGSFFQTPQKHIDGQGCPKCAGTQKLTTEEFIARSKQVHNSKYDYSQVKYINNHSKIKIICPIHGEFWQMALNHMKGCGCPKCVNRSSKDEMRINDFLNKYVSTETTVRNVIHPYELDIYIPNKRVAIEYDGLYWHNDKNVDNNYHLMKTELCEKQGIQLIHIFEDEWMFHTDIVKSKLKDSLNLKMINEISTSDCRVKEITNSNIILTFLEENSLYSPIISHYCYGLYHNDDLVSIMIFNDTNTNGMYELAQFCNIQNTEIKDSSKILFQKFIEERKPNEIIYYDDRRWNNYKLIFDLQLNKFYDIPPDYFYIKGYIRENKSEHINISNNIHKIYDCGKTVYKWVNK